MTSILTLQGIHKTFEAGTPNENHVLKGIDLTMEKGDFITIIGGNGAGKSTFLNSIAGSLIVDEGKITIDGKDVTNLTANKRAGLVSRVFQDTRMGTASRLTIEENMAIADRRGKSFGFSVGVTNKQRQVFKEALKRLDLGLENRLTTEVGALSGGQRQALTLLMATLKEPKVLLLDEHTAALDPKTSDMVLGLTEEVIASQGLTALMITHDMEQAIHMGNRLLMMDNGRIVVDVSGEEKANLTVQHLLDLFKQKSGRALNDDALILG
ncbi:ABC transporter ATP-binding protein [Aerococcus agrisoli]|uniref:ABC transporter ATP-binding protein n=1 Tax=Aerococcus agrisoli TaxID=2487350 RepID=A0A3N4G7B9_9LACT|nr:ABC transporter ATP-binding protein [Aerococcus agrisoli]RPA58653.1 ABC transporter ATP-binding protein [Aerococcus agrisoli]